MAVLPGTMAPGCAAIRAVSALGFCVSVMGGMLPLRPLQRAPRTIAMPRTALLPAASSALIALLLPAWSQAQSRIDDVLVYPGGAQVTRLAPVAAGARELVLTCLTARFDPDTLQIDAPAGVNLGPVQVETLPRDRAPDCANSALDEQLRKLEAQRDSLTAESGALDTGLGYLKALGSGDARNPPTASAEPRGAGRLMVES